MQSKKKDNKSFKKTKGDEKMPISNKGEELAMIAVLRGGTNNRAEIRLHTSDPGAVGTTSVVNSGWTASGANGSGLTPTSYPQTTWTIPPGGGQSTNASAVSFTRNAGASTITVTHISVWKVGVPDFVWKAPVSSVTWSENQTITFEINAIKLDLGNV